MITVPVSCFHLFDEKNKPRVGCLLLDPFCALSHSYLCQIKSLLSYPTLRPHARQPPLFGGLFRQEYWSGLPSPPPGDLPDPEIKNASPSGPALQADSLPLSDREGPHSYLLECKGLLVESKDPGDV